MDDDTKHKAQTVIEMSSAATVAADNEQKTSSADDVSSFVRKSTFVVAKPPSMALARTNCVFLHPDDITLLHSNPSRSSTSPTNLYYVFINGKSAVCLQTSSAVKKGELATTLFHRKLAAISIGDTVTVEAFTPNKQNIMEIKSLNVTVDFLRRSTITDAPFQIDAIVKRFLDAFEGQVYTVGQQASFDVSGTDLVINIISISTSESSTTTDRGILIADSKVTISKRSGSQINLVNTDKETTPIRSVKEKKRAQVESDEEEEFSSDISDVEQLSEVQVSESSSSAVSSDPLTAVSMENPDLDVDSILDSNPDDFGNVELKQRKSQRSTSPRITSPTRGNQQNRRRKSSISSVASSISTLSHVSSVGNDGPSLDKSSDEITAQDVTKLSTKAGRPNSGKQISGAVKRRMKDVEEVTEPESENDSTKKGVAGKKSTSSKTIARQKRPVASASSEALTDVSASASAIQSSDEDQKSAPKRKKQKQAPSKSVTSTKTGKSKKMQESDESGSSDNSDVNIDSDSGGSAEQNVKTALDTLGNKRTGMMQNTLDKATPKTKFYGNPDYYDPILNPDYVSPYTEFTRPLIDPNDIDGSDFEYGRTPPKVRARKQKGKKKKVEIRKRKSEGDEGSDDDHSRKNSEENKISRKKSDVGTNDKATSNVATKTKTVDLASSKPPKSAPKPETADAESSSDSEQAARSVPNKTKRSQSKSKLDTKATKKRQVVEKAFSEASEESTSEKSEEITEVLEVFAKSDKDKDKTKMQALKDFQKIQIERYNALMASMNPQHTEEKASVSKKVDTTVNAEEYSNVVPAKVKESIPVDSKTAVRRNLYPVAPVDVLKTKLGKTQYPPLIKIDASDNDDKILLGKRLVRRELISKQDLSGRTYLHKYAANGSYADVYRLLEAGADFKIRDSAGWTPLHEACGSSHSEIAELIIFVGADVNGPGQDDDTPLHDAISSENIELVKRLLVHGSDMTLPNGEGHTPWEVANPSLRREILRFKEVYDSLDNVENSVDENGNTKLHLACLQNDAKLVHQLLVAGHPVNMKNNEGETPLLIAVKTHSLSIAEDLLLFGSNFNSLVPYAVRRDLMDFVKLFTKYGANLTSHYGSGRKPLEELATSNKMKTLLENLQDMVEKDEDKNIIRKPKFFQPIERRPKNFPIVPDSYVEGVDMKQSPSKEPHSRTDDIDSDGSIESTKKLTKKRKAMESDVDASSERIKEISIDSELNEDSVTVKKTPRKESVDDVEPKVSASPVVAEPVALNSDATEEVAADVDMDRSADDLPAAVAPTEPGAKTDEAIEEDDEDQTNQAEQSSKTRGNKSQKASTSKSTQRSVKQEDRQAKTTASQPEPDKAGGMAMFGDEVVDYFHGISEREKRKIERMMKEEQIQQATKDKKRSNSIDVASAGKKKAASRRGSVIDDKNKPPLTAQSSRISDLSSDINADESSAMEMGTDTIYEAAERVTRASTSATVKESRVESHTGSKRSRPNSGATSRKPSHAAVKSVTDAPQLHMDDDNISEVDVEGLEGELPADLSGSEFLRGKGTKRRKPAQVTTEPIPKSVPAKVSQATKTFNDTIAKVDKEIASFRPRYTDFENEHLLDALDAELNLMSDYQAGIRVPLPSQRVQIVIEEKEVPRPNNESKVDPSLPAYKPIVRSTKLNLLNSFGPLGPDFNAMYRIRDGSSPSQFRIGLSEQKNSQN